MSLGTSTKIDSPYTRFRLRSTGVELKAGKIEPQDRLKPLWTGTIVP
jgi:hypothetical protein